MKLTAIAVGLVISGLIIATSSALENTNEPEPKTEETTQTETVSEPPILTQAEEVEDEDESAAEESAPDEEEDTETVVVVQAGDTLASIAKDYGISYVRLFNANEMIERPDHVVPGTELRIPDDDEELPDRMAEIAAASTPQEPTEPSEPVPEPEPRSEPAPSSNTTSSGVWDDLAQCESNGNWSINTGNGFYGGLQFSLSSWEAVGGTGYPHQASKSEQISRAEKLQAIQGWGAWPSCSSQLGLR